MSLSRILMIATIAALLSGCAKSKEKKVTKFVEDMVGATTIKQGEAIKKHLKEIEKAEEKRVKDLENIR